MEGIATRQSPSYEPPCSRSLCSLTIQTTRRYSLLANYRFIMGLGTSHMENSSHTILFVLSILERQSAMATQLRLAMSAWTFVDATSHHLLGILTNYVIISAVHTLFLEEASSQIHGIDPLLPFLSLNLTYILYSKIE